MKATVPIFGLPVSMKTMARVLAWLRLAHGERFCTIRAFLDISLGYCTVDWNVRAMVEIWSEVSLEDGASNVLLRRWIVVRQMFQAVRLGFDPEFISKLWISFLKIRNGVTRRADYVGIFGTSDWTDSRRLEFPREKIIPRLKAVVRKTGVTFVSVYEVGHGCQRRGTQPTVL